MASMLEQGRSPSNHANAIFHLSRQTLDDPDPVVRTRVESRRLRIHALHVAQRLDGPTVVVLIDPMGINGLPYALESAPLTERVLRDAYGIEYFDPPAHAKWLGIVPIESGQRIWENFSPARWRSIRAEYGVTDVVTPPDWNLQLPMVVGGHFDRLFTIPE